ncbi:uncharacterized protein LOC115411811 [Sphaeramia orbicularis]|uniref:uncharacterized protein LOC115411811 n=1 Tax=Sphaeramia orbicularis TaxID=375764 RepID=UPI00117E434A|nr:uncharacterized protein LOC115411811 [Sphaeramia orbicularis]
MIALVGVLLVVSVSGDDQVEGILGDSVLLPCSCSGRDTTQPMKWQMNEQFRVFKNVNNVSEFNETYEGRARVLLESNCSLVLTRIKKEDRGKYQCICHINERYKDFPVHLTVVAHFNVCQRSETVISPEGENEKVFHCAVSGHDKEAKIQWYNGSLDGQQLLNSSETTITHTYNLNTVNGLNIFSSKLVTHLNTLKPKCDVKSEDVQTTITETCSGSIGQVVQPTQEPNMNRDRNIIIIPFVTVAGLCVVLWRWRKFS